MDKEIDEAFSTWTHAPNTFTLTDVRVLLVQAGRLCTAYNTVWVSLIRLRDVQAEAVCLATNAEVRGPQPMPW